jgi:hypothetical protein
MFFLLMFYFKNAGIFFLKRKYYLWGFFSLTWLSPFAVDFLYFILNYSIQSPDLQVTMKIGMVILLMTHFPNMVTTMTLKIITRSKVMVIQKTVKEVCQHQVKHMGKESQEVTLHRGVIQHLVCTDSPKFLWKWLPLWNLISICVRQVVTIATKVIITLVTMTRYPQRVKVIVDCCDRWNATC